MKTNIKSNLNSLKMPDIFSLMLFILYKTKDIPEYMTLSELCFLLDGSNLIRLLTYFEGKTIKIPSATEFTILTNALLLYEYINIDGKTMTEAQCKLQDLTTKQHDEVMELYLKMLPILKEYNIDRGQVQKNV